MVNSFREKSKSIAEQVNEMKNYYPQFQTSYNTHSSMKVRGELQPTQRSEKYLFELKYNLVKNPIVKIIKPVLVKNEKNEEIPHLYSDGSLCLFHPNFSEFNKKDSISEKIIPWISLWLYYYEMWHLTGCWLGGGEHPIKQKPIINEKRK